MESSFDVVTVNGFAVSALKPADEAEWPLPSMWPLPLVGVDIEDCHRSDVDLFLR